MAESSSPSPSCSASHSPMYRSTESPKSKRKETYHKQPDLGGLSGADIDEVKRRPPTYQANDADLRLLLNSGDYVPTQVSCDVCSSRDWPCVERRPSGKSKRTISHKKCRINGQRRADVMAFRQSPVASSTKSSPPPRQSPEAVITSPERRREADLRISPTAFSSDYDHRTYDSWDSHDQRRPPHSPYHDRYHYADYRSHRDPPIYAQHYYRETDYPMYPPYARSPSAHDYRGPSALPWPVPPRDMYSPACATSPRLWSFEGRSRPGGFSEMPHVREAIPHSPIHMNPIYPPPLWHSDSDEGRHAFRDGTDSRVLPSFVIRRDERKEERWDGCSKRDGGQTPDLSWSRRSSPFTGLATPPPSDVATSPALGMKRIISTLSADSGGDFKRKRTERCREESQFLSERRRPQAECYAPRYAVFH